MFFQEELKLQYNGEMRCSGVHYIGFRLYFLFLRLVGFINLNSIVGCSTSEVQRSFLF